MPAREAADAHPDPETLPHPDYPEFTVGAISARVDDAVATLQSA
jgi:hypothetical protein